MKHLPKLLFMLSLFVICASVWGWAFSRQPFWAFIVMVGLVGAVVAMLFIFWFKKEGI